MYQISTDHIMLVGMQRLMKDKHFVTGNSDKDVFCLPKVQFCNVILKTDLCDWLESFSAVEGTFSTFKHLEAFTGNLKHNTVHGHSPHLRIVVVFN